MDGYGNMSPADMSAIVNNGNRGYGGYGLDGYGGMGIMSWWWMIIFLFMFSGNGRWGNNGNDAIPYLMSENTQAAMQNGFNQQGIQNGINSLNQTVANGFADAAVARCNAQTTTLQALNNNQMGLVQTLNQNQLGLYQNLNNSQLGLYQMLNNNQQGLYNGLNQLVLGQQTANSANQAGLADLKYTVATENCADRQSINTGVRDIIAAQTANTTALAQTITNGIQSIKDDLCADRLAAKDAQIQTLQNQLNMANLAASQSDQTARLIQDNNAQTTALIQRIAPAPIPAYQVPNPATGCCGQGYGCGCNG